MSEINKSLLGLANRFENMSIVLKRKQIRRLRKRVDDPILRAYLKGLGFDVWLPDRKYYLTSWDTWKTIIEYDWVDRRKYFPDFHDCDNFAEDFASRMAYIHQLNSVGVVRHTELLDPDTDKHIGWHRHNLIPTVDNGLFHVYLYEPMTDGWVKMEKNEPTKLGNWIYKLGSIEIK